jgi:predicted nuclease of predicted toxin-antitoxin system
MLKLLLDEHISPHVVDGLRRRNPKLRVFCMRDWEHGRFVGADDELVLAEAAAQGLSLVTYDLRTIPSILKIWAEEGRSHTGVVLVDQKTISTDEIGRLVLALLELVKHAQSWDWKNRIFFLRR